MSLEISRNEFEQFLNELLKPEEFVDYGPNGLQIEGHLHLQTVAFAVSATQDSIKKAIEQNAQALVVHHGLFWKFKGAQPLTGPFAQRVLPLVRAQLNLFGYHLPLDAHPQIGNAAGIAQHFRLSRQKSFGDYQGCPTGIQGFFPQPIEADKFQTQLENLLKHKVIMASPNPKAKLKSLGIITGGASSHWKFAQQESLCAFITGEISEHDWHESQEAGVHMFAGGHNATEVFGVLQLKALVEKTFPALKTLFIPSENPA